MRLGEQGVLSLEQWLEQEAVVVRDAEVAAAAPAAATPAAVDGKEAENTAEPGGLTAPMADSAAGAAPEGNCVAASGGGGLRVGVDPWLLSAGTARSLTAKLAKGGGCLVPISG